MTAVTGATQLGLCSIFPPTYLPWAWTATPPTTHPHLLHPSPNIHVHLTDVKAGRLGATPSCLPIIGTFWVLFHSTLHFPVQGSLAQGTRLSCSTAIAGPCKLRGAQRLTVPTTLWRGESSLCCSIVSTSRGRRLRSRRASIPCLWSQYSSSHLCLTLFIACTCKLCTAVTMFRLWYLHPPHHRSPHPLPPPFPFPFMWLGMWMLILEIHSCFQLIGIISEMVDLRCGETW